MMHRYLFTHASLPDRFIGVSESDRFPRGLDFFARDDAIDHLEIVTGASDWRAEPIDARLLAIELARGATVLYDATTEYLPVLTKDDFRETLKDDLEDIIAFGYTQRGAFSSATSPDSLALDFIFCIKQTPPLISDDADGRAFMAEQLRRVWQKGHGPLYHDMTPEDAVGIVCDLAREI